MPRGKTLLLAGGASITNATFSGQSLFADGTAALPSIAFSAQPNTGIFRNASSDMRITVNGGGVVGFTASDMIPVFDNSLSFGDATHRATNIHTKTVTIGQSLANPLIGEVTLSGAPPLAIIYSPAITATASTRIFLTKCLQRPASIGAAVAISTSVAGVSATVVSLSAGDTSVVNYWIIPTS